MGKKFIEAMKKKKHEKLQNTDRKISKKFPWDK